MRDTLDRKGSSKGDLGRRIEAKALFPVSASSSAYSGLIPRGPLARGLEGSGGGTASSERGTLEHLKPDSP